MSIGWDLSVICASPNDVVPIEGKIFSALFSIFLYPLYSLDIGGFSEEFKNNPYTTGACAWKHFISFKSYVWLYITACVVVSIGMIEDKIKESK